MKIEGGHRLNKIAEGKERKGKERKKRGFA